MVEVWVLGSKNQKAHRTVEWKSPFPNFSNSDILIVNLQSLDLSVKEFVRTLFDEARKQLFDMLMTGDKTVIIIMPSKPTEISWLPIFPVCKPTAPAKIGEVPELPLIKNYLKTVETCSYYFHDIDIAYFDEKTNPKSKTSERYYFTTKAKNHHSMQFAIENKIQNVAKQTVGGSLRAVIYYGTVWDASRDRWVYEGKHISGPVLFLPSSTKLDTDHAIDLLLDSLVGAVVEEPIGPDWEKSIDVPGLATSQSKLQKIEEQIQSLGKRAGEINEEIMNTTRLRRLLWADGGHLEGVVRDAFETLGFSEMRKIRAENLEDWVFDFKHVKEYEHAVLEIKGSEKRTSMADLTQCNKWAEDYMLDGKKAKGVFVTNQFRLTNPETNIKEREQFSPSELEYAKKREICVLPTTKVFDAVVRKMKTGQEPTRAQVEKKIVEAAGLCSLT